jgi:two-component sensor histidine kinase
MFYHVRNSPSPNLAAFGYSTIMPEISTQDYGIGTTLIRELVRQIDGEFILMQDITGTTARIRIPPNGFR